MKERDYLEGPDGDAMIILKLS